MSKTTTSFVQTLKIQAQRQSKLQSTSVLPEFINPFSALIANHAWQSLLFSSFFLAWLIFLIWFEFFFTFVHNMI